MWFKSIGLCVVCAVWWHGIFDAVGLHVPAWGCRGVRHMRRDSPLEPSRSFFVRESRESLKQHYSSWELHRSHNLKMAPPQSINAIGHHLRVLKPFLILNCGSHTNGLEFFISLATQIPFFALIIHR